MALKITFSDAKDYVTKERKLLHAWATKHPFAFGAICLVVGAVVAWVLG